MCVNTTTTTIIEVAEDCQTARMVFVSPGVETSEWEDSLISCGVLRNLALTAVCLKATSL